MKFFVFMNHVWIKEYFIVGQNFTFIPSSMIWLKKNLTVYTERDTSNVCLLVTKNRILYVAKYGNIEKRKDRWRFFLMYRTFTLLPIFLCSHTLCSFPFRFKKKAVNLITLKLLPFCGFLFLVFVMFAIFMFLMLAFFPSFSVPLLVALIVATVHTSHKSNYLTTQPCWLC